MVYPGAVHICPPLNSKRDTLSIADLYMTRRARLRGSLTKEEGSKALTALARLIKQMKEASVKYEAAALIIAVEEGLTYYDASYIQAAIDNALILVTDDAELLSKGKRYVETQASAELG